MLILYVYVSRVSSRKVAVVCDRARQTRADVETDGA